MNAFEIILVSIASVFILIIVISFVKGKNEKIVNKKSSVGTVPVSVPSRKNANWKKVAAWTIPIVLVTIITLFVIGSLKSCGGSEPEKTQESRIENTVPKYGTVYVTQEKPGRIYADPMKTHIRPQGEVRYVFELDESIAISEDRNGFDSHVWWGMPRGMYLIYAKNPGETIRVNFWN